MSRCSTNHDSPLRKPAIGYLITGLLFLFCTNVACSGETSEGDSSPLDADASVTDTSSTADASDISSDGSTDSGDSLDARDAVDAPDALDPFSLEALSERAGQLNDFHMINEDYGVEFTKTYRSNGSDSPYAGMSMVFLLDFSPPEKVELSDFFVEDETFVDGTTIDETTIVVREDNSGDNNFELQASSYSTSGGTFEELDSLELPVPSYRSDHLQDVVRTDQRVVVVCEDVIFELELGEDGALEVVSTIDRKEEMDELGIQNIRWGFLRDTYTMTSDGHLLSVYDGVRLWRLDAGEDESHLVGSLAIDSLGSNGWVYDSEAEMVYTGGNYTSNEEYEDPAYAVDVSDPANPTIAKQWDVDDDFGRQAGSPRDAVMHDGTIYFHYGTFDRTKDAIWSFDVGTEGTDLQPSNVVMTQDLPESPAILDGMHIRDGMMFYGYSNSPKDITPPMVRIGSVPLSYFESD